MLPGCALPAIIVFKFECSPASLQPRLRNEATQSIVSNACLPMHARTNPHTHTHTRYHMSRYYKSICLHNQWHLPSQQMPFEQIELPAKLLDSFLWSNKSNINQMPPPPMALANTIKGICTRNKRHLPPQQKAFTFTIKSICLRHSIYSHIYTLTPCMLKRHL